MLCGRDSLLHIAIFRKHIAETVVFFFGVGAFGNDQNIGAVSIVLVQRINSMIMGALTAFDGPYVSPVSLALS